MIQKGPFGLARLARRVPTPLILGGLVLSLVGAAPSIASTRASAAALATGSTYHSVTPVRLLDTRYGNGLDEPLRANTPVTFQIAGRAGVPDDATAVTGNVTVTDETDGWAVYVGPDPVAFPQNSTVNFVKGDIVANGITVALGSHGTLSATYMALSGNTTDLVFDLTGYFTLDSSGDTYHAIDPTRLLDTRYGNGLSARLSANAPATFQITGRGGIPAGATAITGNVTVTDETDSWAIFVGPIPIVHPASSTLNFVAGDIRANGLTVALGAGGKLSATYMARDGATTDLVVDVTGYFTHDSSGSRYVPMAPARLLDTRAADGLGVPLPPNAPATFQVTGRGSVPTFATAVTGNVTVTDESDYWAIFVGPVPIATPTSSTLNFVKGDIRANNLTVALGSGGTLRATYMAPAASRTELVFDVTGYFIRSAPTTATWTLDLYDPRSDRWQDPDYKACTAAATESMLNTVAYAGAGSGLVWQPTTSFATQGFILAYERANMTMLTSSLGTDPHGWRNALNYYGWGNMAAGVYRDSSYGSFDDAARAAVLALAKYGKPTGILALHGRHAEYITGYQVTGDDPRTGSANFTIVGVDLTDPLESSGRRDTWIPYADWRSGDSWVQFGAYFETDSPYGDPIDGRIGYDEWYGRWVIIDPVE